MFSISDETAGNLPERYVVLISDYKHNDQLLQFNRAADRHTREPFVHALVDRNKALMEYFQLTPGQLPVIIQFDGPNDRGRRIASADESINASTIIERIRAKW